MGERSVPLPTGTLLSAREVVAPYVRLGQAAALPAGRRLTTLHQAALRLRSAP